jgi:hypothetical protein
MAKTIIWNNALSFSFESVDPSTFRLDNVELRYREDVDTVTDVLSAPITFTNTPINITSPTAYNFTIVGINPSNQFFLNDFSYEAATYSIIENVTFIANQNDTSRGLVFSAKANSTSRSSSFIARESLGNAPTSSISTRITTLSSATQTMAVTSYPQGDDFCVGCRVSNSKIIFRAPLHENYDEDYRLDVTSLLGSFIGDVVPVLGIWDDYDYYYTTNQTTNTFYIIKVLKDTGVATIHDSIVATNTKTKYTALAIAVGQQVLVAFDDSFHVLSGNNNSLGGRTLLGLNFGSYWFRSIYFDEESDTYYLLGNDNNGGVVPSSYSTIKAFWIDSAFAAIHTIPGTINSGANLLFAAERLVPTRLLLFSGTSLLQGIDMDSKEIAQTQTYIALPASLFSTTSLLTSIFKRRKNDAYTYLSIKNNSPLSSFSTNSVHNLFVVQ